MVAASISPLPPPHGQVDRLEAGNQEEEAGDEEEEENMPDTQRDDEGDDGLEAFDVIEIDADVVEVGPPPQRVAAAAPAVVITTTSTVVARQDETEKRPTVRAVRPDAVGERNKATDEGDGGGTGGLGSDEEDDDHSGGKGDSADDLSYVDWNGGVGADGGRVGGGRGGWGGGGSDGEREHKNLLAATRSLGGKGRGPSPERSREELPQLKLAWRFLQWKGWRHVHHDKVAGPGGQPVMEQTNVRRPNRK